jgi:predicted nucleic acid-binding protein
MEWRQVDRLLSAFLVYWPTDAEMQQCMKQFTGYRLAHNLGILDALIAVTAVGRGEPLATFNVRHYRAVSGLMIVQPYTR